jgi:hypothetical protein
MHKRNAGDERPCTWLNGRHSLRPRGGRRSYERGDEHEAAPDEVSHGHPEYINRISTGAKIAIGLLPARDSDLARSSRV